MRHSRAGGLEVMCQVTAALSRILPCKHPPGGQQLLHKYGPQGRVGPSKVRHQEGGKTVLTISSIHREPVCGKFGILPYVSPIQGPITLSPLP